MFFFGKNLKFKHKVTLCLVMYGILANWYLWMKLTQIPFDWSSSNGKELQFWVAFLAFVKCIVLCIFRKF